MLGGPRLRYSGYANDERGLTVVEIMIVLAVTAVLFVAAAAMIAGRQNRTAFEQAIRDVQSQIQKTINEVSIGYYPNFSNFQCTGSAATGVVITPASGVGQGTNSGCILAGKALQFKLVSTDPEEFATFTIAGVQKGASGGTDSVTISDAEPKAVAPTTTLSLPNATETSSLQSGLHTYDMWYMNGATKKPVAIIAFTPLLAPGGVQSPTQLVNLVPIDPSGLDVSTLDGAEAINSRIAVSPVNPTSGVFICFASGGTDQSGLITIGSNARQLTVTLDIKSNSTCS